MYRLLRVAVKPLLYLADLRAAVPFDLVSVVTLVDYPFAVAANLPASTVHDVIAFLALADRKDRQQFEVSVEKADDACYNAADFCCSLASDYIRTNFACEEIPLYAPVAASVSLHFVGQKASDASVDRIGKTCVNL